MGRNPGCDRSSSRGFFLLFWVGFGDPRGNVPALVASCVVPLFLVGFLGAPVLGVAAPPLGSLGQPKLGSRVIRKRRFHPVTVLAH